MARFFIDRPVFAIVISLFLVLVGSLSLMQLPVGEFPNIALPTVRVSSFYLGASSDVVEQSRGAARPRHGGPRRGRAGRRRRHRRARQAHAGPAGGATQIIGGAAPSEPARVSVNVMVTPRDGAATEINVIGCSFEEALGRLDRFLDDLLLTDERQVRIIHGFGTGQLRRAIGEYLDRHPLVAAHQPAAQEHGGGGVTVAELKD